MYSTVFIILTLIFISICLISREKFSRVSDSSFKLHKKANELISSKHFIRVAFGFFIFVLVSTSIGMCAAGYDSQSESTLDGNPIWQKTDMGFSIEEQKNLAIGPARGDGTIRVYSTTNEVNEYTFLNGEWKQITFGDDFLSNSGIAIGKVRDDGRNRIYITKYSVHEYEYDSKWNGGEVRSTSIIDEDGIAIGDVRNDGINRIYICDRDGIKELSYDYGDWTLKEIDNHPYAKLTIADGRNDGVLRLYAAISDHVYEFSWTENTWQVKDCSGFNIYNSLSAICSGDGRNDGKSRIYVSGTSKDSDGAIYELSYDGQSWQQNIVSDSTVVDHLIIGKGKNDGINRLYTGSSKGIGEYTYSGSWVKTSNIESSLKINDLAVGKGRNDELNRIYATADDKHIYEYSFTKKAETVIQIETESEIPSEKEKEMPTEIKTETSAEMETETYTEMETETYTEMETDSLKSLFINPTVIAAVIGSLIGLFGIILSKRERK